MRKVLIRVAAALGLSLIAATAAGAAWWHSLDLASQPPASKHTRPEQLDIMQAAVRQPRGRILTIVTSTANADGGKINAGFELTELSRAYYVFKANGYDVEIASAKGGRPPVNIDEELVDADFAFLNDSEAQRLLASTIRLNDVDASRYDAVYVVGGKGVMFDLAKKGEAQRIIAEVYDEGGVVGAVCHGPVALLETRLADGTPILEGKRVAGFSNEEEEFIIENAKKVFPFLLEDALRASAGVYSEGAMYLDHTITDGRLVTGQNPWSTWSVAESMVRALGHTPVARPATREEKAIEVLDTLERRGFDAAQEVARRHGDADKRLILLHALIAAMQGEVGRGFTIQRLAH